VKSKPRTKLFLRPLRNSAFAFLPLLAVCLLFLADVEGWQFLAVGYGMAGLFARVLSVFFLIYFFVELTLRVTLLVGSAKIPWFSLILAISLPSLFYVGKWVEPIVMRNPSWCHVSQIMRSKTSDDGWFVLVLHGRGNINHHEFQHGFLNCGLGERRGGISDIKFRPLRFGWWNGYDQEFADATPSLLMRRVAVLDYPESELNVVIADVWEILQQADRGDPLSSQSFDIEPMWEAPNNGAHHKFGTLVLINLAALAYLVVGLLTLPHATKQIAK